MDSSQTKSDQKRTLSASQVNKYYNCSRMWAYEYVAGIKPPPTYPMKKGTFIHAVIERFNRGLDSPPEDNEKEWKSGLRDRILGVARELWQDGLPGEFEDEMRDDHHRVRKQMYHYVDTLLKRYRDIRRRTDLSPEEAWRRARPTANELSIVVTNEQGEWLFRGDIDAVFEKHPLWFDRTAIVDYKTGSSPFNAEEPMSVEYSRQLDIYTWLYYQAFGCVPEVAGIQFLSEPPGNPTAFVYKEVDAGTVESTHLMLRQVRRQLESEQVEDYDRNTRYKWCEFEKKDGTMIRCDHWDYCLGNEDMPGPTPREYDGPEREPIEVVMRDPLEDQLQAAEHAPAMLDGPENGRPPS